MKKILPQFTMVLLSFLLLSFIYSAADHSAATAEQQDGIYIFLMCKPAAAYEVQGSVKVGMTVTSNPLDVLVRKCKKDYPAAEAILISDPNLQSAKANCIKFKE